MSCINKLYYLLIKHLSYVETIHIITLKIERASHLNNIDQIEHHTLNRDRVINISENTQKIVEAHISSIPTSLLTENVMSILRSWAKDTDDLLSKTGIINEKITCTLENKKNDLSKEIAEVFNIKQAHNGYMLNDTRK